MPGALPHYDPRSIDAGILGNEQRRAMVELKLLDDFELVRFVAGHSASIGLDWEHLAALVMKEIDQSTTKGRWGWRTESVSLPH